MTNPNPGVRDHAPPGPERLLAGLTPEQAQAVTFGTGPLLLLAGPGAGKTRTLTHRAAYLLASGRAQPWEILAVTFSVRAAGELRLRLADLLGETVARGVTAATFHSVCARLLREHAGVFGRTERYTIYDQADMRRVIDWLLSDAERGEIQRALADYGQPASAEVLAEISRAKNALLTPGRYERSAAHPARAADRGGVARERDASCGAATRSSSTICSRARSGCSPSIRIGSRGCASGGGGSWPTSSRTPATRRRRSSTCSPAPTGTCACVGDDDQLIHGWRHADPRHILCFAERHPGRTQIVLGRNFRSRAEILEAAVRCVSHNERRRREGADRDARLRRPGSRAGVRERVRRGELGDRADRRRARRRHAAGEILALARTGYATEPLQRALAHAGIPHRVLGSLGLYERTEVRDALAYLTLIAEPARRAGVPPRDRLAPARDRRRDRHASSSPGRASITAAT